LDRPVEIVVATRGVWNFPSLMFDSKAVSFGLLAKGCLERKLYEHRSPHCGKRILLPTPSFALFRFLDASALARNGWPMLPVAGPVWLLMNELWNSVALHETAPSSGVSLRCHPYGEVETDPWMRRSHESLPFTFCKCNLTMGLTARDWNAGFDIIHTQCVCQCHCSNPSDHPSAKFFSAKYVLNSWAGE
jgi:hypothetical protein